VLLTYVSLAMAVWHIRNGRVEQHRAWMVSLYFGAASGWMPALIAIPLALIASCILWRRLMPKRKPRLAAV